MTVPHACIRGLGSASHRTVSRSPLHAGSAVPASPAGWLTIVSAHPDVSELRADGQRNVLAVAAWVARRADPKTGVSRPLWAALSDRTGLSRASVARWLSWLHQRDLMATVAHGRTAAMRPAVLAGRISALDAGNEAAEYLLCQPRPPKTKRPDKTPSTPEQISETPLPSW